MGAIADRAKAYLPITWEALDGHSSYGPAVLQGRINAVKTKYMGAGAPDETEEDDITEALQEFFAKKTVLLIIPAAIDFWMNKPIEIHTTGTNESVTYEGRIEHLRELFKQIAEEVALEEPTIGTPIIKTSGYPAVSDGNGANLITHDPFAYPSKWNIEEV